MDVISFLKGFVNKSENINELITLFLDRGQYNFGALFYKKSNTTYELIEHISRCYNEIGNISFSPFCSISNITISNNSSELFGYKSPYLVKNIIKIPITINFTIIK